MIKKDRVLKICIVLLLLLAINVSASQLSSTNYNLDSVIISSGGKNTTSTNYQTKIVLNTITGNLVSSLYNQTLGFWYTATLDWAKPLINNITVTPSKGSPGTLFDITANITDAGIDTVIAHIQDPDENDIANVELKLNSKFYNGTWDSTGNSEGTYIIDIIANDTFGNQKEYENGEIIALSSYAQDVYINSDTA